MRALPYGELSGKSKGVGDAGVGGGGCGETLASSWVVLREAVLSGVGALLLSVSVSEPDDSRSQLSATGLDFGLCSGFWGTVVESWRWESVVAISEAVSGVTMSFLGEMDVPVSLGVLRTAAMFVKVGVMFEVSCAASKM